MKLATFSGPDGLERFGAVLDGRVVPFAELQLRGGRSGAVPGPAGCDALDGIEGYLRSLPVARAAARPSPRPTCGSAAEGATRSR